MSGDRECRAEVSREVAAPSCAYLPQNPKRYRPSIGLIGCGGIAPYHLQAYRTAGYHVVALCDVDTGRAQSLAGEFYREAAVYNDYLALLERPDIDVVDIATHPSERVRIIEAALNRGKHVLSQKPFVLDLDEGTRLADLADGQGVLLAVNQNGRWAPHFSYMRSVVDAGLIGVVSSIRLAVHWDHNWTADTTFNTLRHLILYDFAVHWFDIVNCFMGDATPRQVYATAKRTAHQRTAPPLLSNVEIVYDSALVSLGFNADTRFGQGDASVIVGNLGCIASSGPDLNTQTVTLTTAAGRATPTLAGDWFTNGFHGTMAELLCAIEEGRQPYNSARHNLRTLALCFAAIESADTGAPVIPGTIRRVTP